MTISDVKNYYVTWQNAMRKLGYSSMAYRKWLKRGNIPLGAQIRIEHFSNGDLKADIVNDETGRDQRRQVK